VLSGQSIVRPTITAYPLSFHKTRVQAFAVSVTVAVTVLRATAQAMVLEKKRMPNLI
jgi:hypothetical protein